MLGSGVSGFRMCILARRAVDTVTEQGYSTSTANARVKHRCAAFGSTALRQCLSCSLILP